MGDKYLYFEILKHPSIFCVKGNHDIWVANYIADYFDGQVRYPYMYNTFEQLRETCGCGYKEFCKMDNPYAIED